MSDQNEQPQGRPPRKEMAELSWWSVASVVGSFILITAGQQAFFVAFGFSGEGEAGPGFVYMIGSVVLAGVMGVVGGLLSAWLAPSVPMRHATALATVVFVMGAANLIVAVQPEAQVDPVWAVVAKLLLSVGGIGAGAWALLKVRRPDPFEAAADEARGDENQSENKP